MAGTDRKLNLGCGVYPMTGYINIDKNLHAKADIVRDVRQGLPFDDGSVAEVRATHFLEHLTVEEMMWCFQECYRVLVPNGKMYIRVPLLEPYSLDHKQAFAEWSFDPLERPETPAYYQSAFHWKILSKKRMPSSGGIAEFDQLEIILQALK